MRIWFSPILRTHATWYDSVIYNWTYPTHCWRIGWGIKMLSHKDFSSSIYPIAITSNEYLFLLFVALNWPLLILPCTWKQFQIFFHAVVVGEPISRILEGVQRVHFNPFNHERDVIRLAVLIEIWYNIKIIYFHE